MCERKSQRGPKRELTRVSIVNRAQIEYDWDASAQPYAVLDRLTVMTQDPEQSYKVAFKVRKVGSIRPFFARNGFSAFRGCPGPPKIDTWEKVVK